MNIQKSIRQWIQKRIEEQYIDLDGIQIAITGEEDDVTPPFIGIYETGESVHETGNVTMYGVTEYEISVELHTVPTDENNEGTPIATEHGWRQNLYDILGDRDMIAWATDRNGSRVFDIRLPSGITESDDGQRITRFEMTVIACPI